MRPHHAKIALILSALGLLLTACPSPSQAPDAQLEEDAKMSAPDSAPDLPQPTPDMATPEADLGDMGAQADLGDVDTDGDGLSDAQERMLGTDPTLMDTDADGIADGDELSYGLDPNNPSSFGDGVLDGARATYSSCADNLSTQVSYHVSAPGDWTVALPTDASYHDVQLITPEDKRALALYEAADTARQGLIYSMPKATSDPELLRALVELKARLSTRFEVLNDLSQNMPKTHDGFDQVSMQLQIKPAPNTSVEALRATLIEGVSGLSAGQLQGLPTLQSTSISEHYTLGVTIVERADRRILLAALVPSSDREQDVFWQEDITNATHLASASATAQGRCTTQRVNLPQTPAAIPLSGWPVAGTLVVYMEDPADPTRRVEVPRSRVDGFAYAAQSNRIVLYGSFATMQTKSIALHYMRFGQQPNP